jgi:hypothetical protein
MDADDEKKLDALWYADKTTRDKLREAYALGCRAGMTEAAGICRAQRIGIDAFGGIDCHIDMTRDQCAAAIEKARDA